MSASTFVLKMESESSLRNVAGSTPRSHFSDSNFIEHVDSFKVWRRWLGEGKLNAPFEVVHVDAHGDFGAGFQNSTYSYLQDVLAKLDSRDDLDFSPEGTTSANYLTLAIANRWISSLTYVYPTDPLAPTRKMSQLERMVMLTSEQREQLPPVRDVPARLFQKKDGCWWQGRPIQLGCDEPEIPFRVVKQSDFSCSGFTHMVVAQSPQYTPQSADNLLALIERYFRRA